MSDKIPSPLEVFKTKDRGSDIARRYRYQASYAATVSLKLLEENADYKKIICEHIEDVLIVTTNDKYIGCQVKTRESSTFTFDSPDIKKSIKRFVYTHKKYGEIFAQYILVTNCGFSKRNDYRDMELCVRELRNNPETIMENLEFNKKVKEIAKETGTSDQQVIDTLKKTYVEKGSSLTRYETILGDDISICLKLNNINMSTLRKCAIELVDMAFRKSAEPYDNDDITYYKSLEKLESNDTAKLVNNKTIKKEDVLEIVSRLNFYDGRLLVGNGEEVDLTEDIDDMTTLEKKLSKGKIYAKQIDKIKVSSYDLHRLAKFWLYSFDKERALEYYRHVKSIVSKESTESYHDKYKEDIPFGRDMLRDIQNRLKNRYEIDIANKIPSCYYEDLIGMCGILTNQCKLWWSEEFVV